MWLPLMVYMLNSSAAQEILQQTEDPDSSRMILKPDQEMLELVPCTALQLSLEHMHVPIPLQTVHWWEVPALLIISCDNTLDYKSQGGATTPFAPSHMKF